MSETNTHAKKRRDKLSADEKREAVNAANRKAQMQWYLIGGLLFVAVVGAIVLISIFTEGSLPTG